MANVNYFEAAQAAALARQTEAAQAAVAPVAAPMGAPAPFMGNPAQAPAPAPVANVGQVASTVAGTARTRKEGTIYVNVGLPMQVQDPETGEVRIETINLPFGLDLANMSKSDLKGLGPSIAQLRTMGNDLLETLLHWASTTIGSGEAVVLPTAVVTIRHAGKKAVVIPADRRESFVTAVGAMFDAAIPVSNGKG